MDQLRHDFWSDGARKCDTHKALDFLTSRFATTRLMVQIHSPQPLPNSCLSLVYATFCFFTEATFCGPLWTNSKPKPIRIAKGTERTQGA